MFKWFEGYFSGSNFIFLLFAFLSGLFFPIGVVRSDKFLNIIGYLLLLSYPSSIMGSACFWNVPAWILDSNLYPNLTYFSDLHNRLLA
ncbi:hypothetical protein [Spiroplasma sp. ald]|uniref:hypothetical protein n=1 Tax=Spiroplasma sp. ald TaxID=2490849 RepID=UPI0037DBFBE9